MIRDPELELSSDLGDPNVAYGKPSGGYLRSKALPSRSTQSGVRLYRHDVVATREIVGGVVAVVHTDVQYEIPHSPPRSPL
jgi:hypothetical protein